MTCCIQIHGAIFIFFCQKQGRKQLFVSKKSQISWERFQKCQKSRGEKSHNFEQKWPDPYRKNQKVVIFTIGIWKKFFWSPTCWWNLKIAKKNKLYTNRWDHLGGVKPRFSIFFQNRSRYVQISFPQSLPDDTRSLNRKRIMADFLTKFIDRH